MTSDKTIEKTGDMAGQPIDITWHVWPGDTSVQILHNLHEFMSGTTHAPESYPDMIMVTSMFQ